MAGKQPEKKIVIVVKKKARHQASHGGSWKVAYADFVTAMMAFFLVMWILGMDPQVRDLIQGYFNNPGGTKRGSNGGANVVGQGSTPLSLDAQRLALLARENQRRRFEETRADIIARMERTAGLEEIKAQVEIIITEEGLRIELIEGGDGATFFALGSATLTPAAAQALRLIAGSLQDLPNDLKLEGHTDAAQYGRRGYSNWELSTDRANTARRALEGAGIDGARVAEVRGHADRELRNPGNPLDPANRRISILLPFKDPGAIEVVRPLFNPLGNTVYGGD
jgi:chemotaxis protein MotB